MGRTAYRLLQEALHNIAKHAHASSVTVRLGSATDDSTALVLEVVDDGVGFDPAEDRVGHLGLTSMRERADQLGGSLAVMSRPRHGTAIRATIPHVFPKEAGR